MNVVLLQCMCTLVYIVCTCTRLCVGWGGRGETYIDILVRNHRAQWVWFCYRMYVYIVHVRTWQCMSVCGSEGDIQAKDLYMYTLFTGSELASLSSFFCRSLLWSSLVTASPWASTVVPWRLLLLKERRTHQSCLSRYVRQPSLVIGMNM